MVLNQTLGSNALRQDLNRRFYSAPIGTSAFAPNGFDGQAGFYGQPQTGIYGQPQTGFNLQALYNAPNYYAQNVHVQSAQALGYGHPNSASQGHFVPKANFAETVDAIIATIELPGVELSQVALSIHGNVLVLEGVRQPGGLIGNQMVTYQATEGRFGTFRWIGQIPNGTMALQIEAIFRNGLLTIVLPKANAQAGIANQGAQAGVSPAPFAQVVINPAVNG